LSVGGSGSDGEVTVSLGCSIQLEHTVSVLSVLALLLNNVCHKLGYRLGGGVSVIREGGPIGTKEGASHGSLQALEVTFGHNGLDNINGSSVEESITRDGPLGKVEDDEEGEVLQAVGSPAGRRGRSGTDVLNDTLGNIGLANESGILFTLREVLDETASPTDTFGFAGSRLGNGWRVSKELLENAKERVGVVKWSESLSVSCRRMLQDGGDASLEEGKVHEANAAQVRFLLIFSDNLAKSSDDILRGGSKSHDALVFGRDRKVVEGKAGKVASISAFLGQALGERSQHVVFSTADHRDTVLLVADIAEFVDTLGCGRTLFSLRVEHLVNQLRDIIESRRLSRSRLHGGLLARSETKMR